MTRKLPVANAILDALEGAGFALWSAYTDWDGQETQRRPLPGGRRGIGGRTVNTAVHFSSASGEWSTPPDVFAALDAEFGFTLDPCATPDNAKCARYFTRGDDGLAQSWTGERVFMNPPYGRVIGGWMRKAYEESRGGALVVCLIPARTDTAWWHDYVIPYGETRFIRGRLKFGGAANSAPFPSAIVVFRPLRLAP